MKAPSLLLLLFCVFTGTAGAQPAKLLHVSGDRQVVVGDVLLPAPIVTRVVDAMGAPVEGVLVLTGPLAHFRCRAGPIAYDEFGFRGFNVIGGPGCYEFPLQGMKYTDANGLSSESYGFGGNTPSSYLLGAVVIEGTQNSQTVPPVLFSVVRVRQAPAGRPSVVVEYFNPISGHYFNTISQEEIDALEAGSFAGWKRSTGSFIAYETQADAPEGAVPVCRFFSSKFTSHFYTADVAECNLVERELGEDWVLETRAAFYINVPDKLTGTCGAGLQPIHRMFNNRAIPNHRYIADAELRNRMSGAGWVAEGYGGENAVMLCTPA